MNTPDLPRRRAPRAGGGLESDHPQPWQIPQGVAKGNWDYVRARQIAADYDQFLTGDPLSRLDRKIVDRYLPPHDSTRSPAPIVADFGCGTGRTLIPLLENGYSGVGFDLSQPMLNEFQQKVEKNHQVKQQPVLIQANLVELDGIGHATIDHGISLFSTLGMIQGAANRAQFLRHARRIIKPNGYFILHAHNVWHQVRQPGAMPWLMKSLVAAARGRQDFGDRTAVYRGVNQVFIHSFRRTELQSALTHAGFNPTQWYGVVPDSDVPVEKFSLRSTLGMVGWIVVCQ